MPTIYVDDRPYEVKEGQNLLQACLSLGFDLPYFCWHPVLHSVGACRQCAVKQYRDEKDTRGRIVMACMTPAAEGTRISIDDPDAVAFRASVIEWLMVNHPHDCPVCDEGGECHLQDMTVMTGHVYRRSRFKKRTYRNQDLGPFVSHEMNRCIQCYRCVRYYRDYAGGRDLNVFAAHDHVYFGRHESGVLESEFSGNLVEVCPTGVFTDKTLGRHYTRKWDLQQAPSVCVHCSLGCNTLPGERYEELRRIRNRYNGEVNGYFLCDRGRYGYEFVNSDARIRQPLVRSRESGGSGGSDDFSRPSLSFSFGGPTTEVVTTSPRFSLLDPEAAVRRVADLLSASRGVIGIGSPRASLEANFALRALVGPERFYLGISETEARLTSAVLEILRRGPAPTPSLAQVRASDAVLVLGEDVTNTAPVLALALRQSVRQQPIRSAAGQKIPAWNEAAVRDATQGQRGPLFLATTMGTKLEEVATEAYHGAPEEVARLGLAVARALSQEAPAVPGLPEELAALAERIAAALRGAERPLVVSGTGGGSAAILQAAANVAWALRAAGLPATLSFALPECNSLGLALMGGGGLEEAFGAVGEGKADTVVVLENDLYRRAEAPAVDAFLAAARHVIVLDHLATPTAERAEVVLPAATFAESDGTFVNNEGRAQRFFQVFVPTGDVRESWRWLRDAMVTSGRLDAGAWRGLDEVIASLAEALPFFRPAAAAAPPAGFRIAGLKIARQHQRYTGRTAMTANVDVSEPKPPQDPDSPLTFSMEGYGGQPPSSLIARFWAPRWNSIQSLNKFQEEVGGPLRGGDPGVRLVEPRPAEGVTYFQDVPAAYRSRKGEWLVVPAHHLFGSEELSMRSSGVAQLAPRPYFALNAEEGARLGLREGEELDVSLGGATRPLSVRMMPEVPPGVAAVPAGLPELSGVELPTWVRL